MDYSGTMENLESAVVALESGQWDRLVLVCDDLDQLYADILKLYELVVAAGGLVINKDSKDLLVMYRRKHYDFPKGKIESGEKKKATAIREVQEECGLNQIDLKGKLCKTFHAFGSVKHRKLKLSHWYYMETSDLELTPQTEEDIESVEWMSPQAFLTTCKPVYPNILDVYESYVYKYK